ncbi:histidine phosphatase family protein [Flavobacterium degerlachei]|jgi:broad specificity phosphatase PhoE|uniref:Histidine phosphatase superfamily (Branch 1) n=1 Tax=Flavobacterium degerlachei TaxID=229203 RepID=A0A1H3DMH9_9FLAO|nr:histidine phosphatase family protein [Flavobacterium degerlachei]SDX67278.1 Histidine phosphatase superfamily (branch 1) [Flavobacterium degerlachei]
MKNILFLLLLICLSATAQSNLPTTIYLVRHAEKVTDDPTNKDPMLTENGENRAIALAKSFNKIAINNIYSTNYKRTIATATPLAKKHKKEIKIYDLKQLKTEAETILKDNKGENALIVGHSNTVLEMIEALGGKRPIPVVSDQEYDYLFQLFIAADGSSEVKVMHYGAINSNSEGIQMMRAK